MDLHSAGRAMRKRQTTVFPSSQTSPVTVSVTPFPARCRKMCPGSSHSRCPVTAGASMMVTGCFTEVILCELTYSTLECIFV